MSSRKGRLAIKKIKVERDGREIIRGVDLEVPAGKIVALMGPNGSGKSTLVGAVIGHPKCEMTGGEIRLDGQAVRGLPPDERARRGLFLSMQSVPEIPGVSVASFLRAALSARSAKPVDTAVFLKELKRRLMELGLPGEFAVRGLNENFSGGEKKRLELLQMVILKPKYALLDEIDAGLDADAMKLLAAALEEMRRAGAGILLVTHSPRIFRVVRPDAVVVMVGGRIVAGGGMELAEKIEKKGYRWLEEAAEGADLSPVLSSDTVPHSSGLSPVAPVGAKGEGATGEASVKEEALAKGEGAPRLLSDIYRNGGVPPKAGEGAVKRGRGMRRRV